MKFFLYFLFTSCVLIQHPLAFAIKLQSSDTPYYIHKTSEFSFIFSEDFLTEDSSASWIYKKLKNHNEMYKEIFTRKLKEDPIYIFASSRNQISNAVTSSTPLKVVFFPTGVKLLTKMAITSWADTLIAHEMAHIYQVGQAAEPVRHLRKVFKNSNVIFIPFPVFLNVNIGMSDFFLEGHAVLNESLQALGGRLYSGSTRAMVLAQIKYKFKNTKQFIADYLVNHTRDYFSGNQHYNHGGYFFTSLREKYTLKKINNIFERHAEHFIIPLSFISVKDAFKHSFKTSFESLSHQYIRRWLPMAKKQKKSEEKSLFTSAICPPFNQNTDQIFFLTSHLNSAPDLRILDKNSGRWRSREAVFSAGKMFNVDGKFYVSSSHKINPVEIAYGLFSEGMEIQKYKSQSVQDLYQDKVLSIDTTNNIKGFDLLLNENFFSKTHSPALFGPQGDIYFFKQEKDKRVMYKNKTPLFEFRGFYGKPVGIGAEGQVYFISTSLYGSSLFSWKKDLGITRLTNSDVVIDAVPVTNKKFLVCEIDPDVYSYKFISANPVKEDPAFYTYSFKTASNAFLLKDLEYEQLAEEALDPLIHSTYEKQVKKLEEAPQVEEVPQIETESSAEESLPRKIQSTKGGLSYKTYHPLKHIRYHGINLGVDNDPITQYKAFIKILFVDSLDYNSAELTYQFSFDNWMIQTKYKNQTNRLGWGLMYNYRQGLHNYASKRAYSYIHEVGPSFFYPLFSKGYWSAKTGLKSLAAYNKIPELNDTFYQLVFQPDFQLEYKRRYRQNYKPHRHLLLYTSLNTRTDLSFSKPYYEWQMHSQYSMHLGWDFYSSAFVNYKTSIKNKAIPFRYFKPLQASVNAELDIYLRDRLIGETNNLFQVGWQSAKFINTPLYFGRFPVSLESLAPLFHVKYINYLNNSDDKKVSLLELAGGISIKLLLHHKIKYTLSFYSGLTRAPTVTAESAEIHPLVGLRFHKNLHRTKHHEH